MRSHIFLIFIVWLLTFSAKAQFLPVSSCPQWQCLNPYPFGENYIKIFSTTQGLIVYTYGSVGVLSHDGGKTWEEFTPKDTAGNSIVFNFNNNFNLQFVNDSVGFFVDSISNIYKSTDGGMIWYPNRGIIPDWYDLRMITENFGWRYTQTQIDTATFCLTYWITSNSGKNWQSTISDTFPQSGYYYPNLYFYDSLHGWLRKNSPNAGDSLILYRTNNGGITWLDYQILSNKNFPRFYQFIDTIRGYGVAYSSDTESYFVYTTNGGASWTPFHTPLIKNDSGWQKAWAVNKAGTFSTLFYYPDPPSDSTRYLMLMYGATTNNGATWTRDSSSPLDYDYHYYFDDVKCFGDGKAGIVGADGLLIITTDKGKTWSKNSFCKTNNIVGLFFKDRNIGFALADSLYKTYNAGREWAPVPNVSFDINANCYSSFKNLNNIWVCSGITAFRSIDSGRTFQTASLPPDTLLAAVDFVDSLYGWAFGKRKGIYKTTNGGATWISQKKELQYDPYNPNMYFGESMVDRNYGWAGEYSYLLRTTNGGITWDTVPVPDNLKSDILLGIQFPTKMHGYICAGGLEVETTDGGATWHTIKYLDEPPLQFRDSLFGWQYWNVTTDGGKTWISRSCSTYLKSFYDLSPSTAWWADTTEGWIAVGNYLYHYGSFDSVQVGVAEPPPLPAANAFLTNYPNPFSTTTNIELQMPFEEPGTLKVYDMLGREVADLTKQVIPGNSTVQFNAAGLQPGVYFCKGVFGTREVTSKLVVVK